MTSTTSITRVAVSQELIDDKAKLRSWQERNVYPLFNEIFKKSELHPIFEFFQAIIVILQVLVTSLGLGSPIIWKNKPKELKYLYALIDWDLSGRTFEESKGQIIALLAILLFFVGYYVFTKIYFHIHHKYSMAIIYQSQIMVLLILPILTPSLGAMCGNLILFINYNQDGAAIGTFAVLSVLLLIMMFELSVTTIINDSSIIISGSPIACWNHNVRLAVYLGNLSSALLLPLASLFRDWITLLIIIYQLVLYCLILVALQEFPVRGFFMNSVMAGIMFGSIAGCILSIIKYIVGDKIGSYVYEIAILVMILIGIVMFTIYFNIKKNIIIRNLTENDNNRFLNNDEYFESLNLTSASEALRYIRIGVAFHCDYILDFSFLTYLVENYANKHLLFAIAQIAVQFPAMNQFISFCMSLMHKYNLDLGEQFIQYQMQRICIIRQSAPTAEANEAYTSLLKDATTIISQTRRLWKEIGISSDCISYQSLAKIRNMCFKMNYDFMDAVESFPNNLQLLKLYLTFQVEAYGSYSNAIDTGRKILMLEEGKSFVRDYVFIKFVNAYDHYLLNNILDVKGNFVGKTISSSFSSFSGPDEFANDEYKWIDDNLNNQFFDHSKLRLALEARLKDIKPSSEIAAVIIEVVQTIAIIFIFSVILYKLPTLLDDSMQMQEGMNVFNKMFMCSQNLMLQGIIQIYKINNDLLGPIYDSLQLKPTFFPDIPSLLFKTDYYVINEVICLKNLFRDTIAAFEDILLDDEMIIFNQEDINVYFIKDKNDLMNGTIINETEISLRKYIIENIDFFQAFDYNYNQTIQAINNGDPDAYDLFLISYVEKISQSFDAFNTSDNLTNNLIDNGYTHSFYISDLLTYSASIAGTLFFLIFFPAKLYNIFYLRRDEKLIVSFLKSVTKKDIDESMNPICKKKYIHPFSSSVVTKTRYSDAPTILYGVISLLSILILTCLFVWSVLINFKEITAEGMIFDLLKTNSNRYIYAVSSIISAFSLKINPYKNNYLFYLMYFSNNTNIENEKFLHNIVDHKAIFQTFFFNTLPTYASDFGDVINTMSINQRFETLLDDIQTFILSDFNSSESLNVLMEMFVYANNYFFNDFRVSDQRIMDYSKQSYVNTINNMTTISVVGIVFAIVSFMYEIYYFISRKAAIEGFSQLILALPPLSVISNSKLMRLILNSGKVHIDTENSTPSQIIFREYKYGLVITDLSLNVVQINKKFTEITEMTPDQVIGQTLGYIFSEDSEVVKLLHNINNRYNGDAEIVYERLFGRETEITLINGTDFHALIVKDLTLQITQESKMKDGINKFETILMNLIPKEVYMNLKFDMNKNIFYSNNSIMISIEISGLSFYVHTMTPSNMMEFIDSIYSLFSEEMAKFEAIKEIKHTDEEYLAICGLFDNKEDIQYQVDQSVAYAFSVVDTIADKFDSEYSLQLNIGIAMTGKVIGNVLNQKTPDFEVFGQSIGNASLIRQEGKQGMIQIDQLVAKYLNKDLYTMNQERSENNMETKEKIIVYSVDRKTK